jgi:hypothetical protein
MTNRTANSFVLENLEARRLMSSGGPIPTNWPDGPRYNVTGIAQDPTGTLAAPIAQPANNPVTAADAVS